MWQIRSKLDNIIKLKTKLSEATLLQDEIRSRIRMTITRMMALYLIENYLIINNCVCLCERETERFGRNTNNNYKQIKEK
jgi:hypothetical protein